MGIASAPPSVCAAAIVSHVARLSVPSRCSATTRITAPSPPRADGGPAPAPPRRRTADHLRLLAASRQRQRHDSLRRRQSGRHRYLADLFLLRGHDALERRVAQLVDAALDRQERRQRHARSTGTSRLRARASRAGAPSTTWTSMMIVECGMPQPLGQHHADLRMTLIVGLQSGQHEIEPLVGHGRRQRSRRHRRIRGSRVHRPRRESRDRRRAPAPRESPAARAPGRPSRRRLPRRASRAAATPPRARRHRARSSRSWRPARGSTSLPSLRRGCHSRVGTCLMQTAIFMAINQLSIK